MPPNNFDCYAWSFQLKIKALRNSKGFLWPKIYNFQIQIMIFKLILRFSVDCDHNGGLKFNCTSFSTTTNKQTKSLIRPLTLIRIGFCIVLARHVIRGLYSGTFSRLESPNVTRLTTAMTFLLWNHCNDLID